MRVALNVYPLQSGHKTRGVGYYTRNLLDALKQIGMDIYEFTDVRSVNNTVDVVHYPWFDLFFRTLKIKNVPTVVTVHDTSPLVFSTEYPVGIRGKINFYLQKRNLKKCKKIITPSNFSKQDIVKFLKINPDKIVVIPEAASEIFKVLSDGEKLSIKRKYKLPDFFLLYVGDANPVKNLPFLIDGFKELLGNFPDLKLVLAGEVFLKKPINFNHPELKNLQILFEKIRNYGLADNIIIPGRVKTEDLVGFYNLATVYVQPSLYEGFGLPVLEAFACGTPVVSSNASSLPEVGGDAALYFDPRSLTQFTGIVTRILQDRSLREKFKKLGLVRSRQFCWDQTAHQTIQVYEDACK